ncbi:MAG: hypothetical protein HPY65_18970 [Syntrophaceae bacterium]|nr:hypothetical protein [Syntrophaceae bacterium]
MSKSELLRITPTRELQLKNDLLDAMLEVARESKEAADFSIRRGKIVEVLSIAAAMATEIREHLDVEVARCKKREADFTEVLKCFQEATAVNKFKLYDR